MRKVDYFFSTDREILLSVSFEIITTDREKAISGSRSLISSRNMQVIPNKKEKEELVVKLHQENKTIRQIAEIVHMSFKDIGVIIRKIDGLADNIDIDLKNKSKTTQALHLFKSGKKPIEVAML